MNQPNRHLTRQAAFQALFEADFRGNDPAENFNRVIEDLHGDLDAKFGLALLKSAMVHQDELDEKLLEAAPDWPIAKVAKVDKTILRLAIVELLYPAEIDNVPSKIVINEAVEIAKKFGGEGTRKFVNGVLGTIYRQYIEAEEDKTSK